MSEFTRGVLFAATLALFGKSMYELGELHEQRKNRKKWKKLEKELYELADILDEAIKKEIGEEA